MSSIYRKGPSSWMDKERAERELLEKQFPVGSLVTCPGVGKWRGIVVPKEEHERYTIGFRLGVPSGAVALVKVIIGIDGVEASERVALWIMPNDVRGYLVKKRKAKPMKKTAITPASNYLEEFGFNGKEKK